MKNPPKLYLMLGYPGAGKTTTAEAIHKLTGAIHLSSDALRTELFHPPVFDVDEHEKLYQALDKRTEQLLSQGKSVIYDANLNRQAHRQDKYEICQRTNANPILVWVQTPKDIAKERATDTNRSHLVPKNETAGEMFDRIANIIEQPQPNEPYITVDGTKVSADYVAKIIDK